MKCPTCKYFAVPLTPEEKIRALCPGANPKGDPAQKVCALLGKPDFNVEQLQPETCPYYLPIFLRFR